VSGVGPLIALTLVLTVEDKDRFQKSRDIGCYLGLRRRRSDSGQSQPQLRITKEGDPYLTVTETVRRSKLLHLTPSLALLGHKHGYHSAVENQAYSQGI
jgi:transposase